MKAKLIKKGEEYHLWVNHIEPKIVPFAKYPWDITKQRLSLKNCQAIERGYDLDELAEEVYPILNLGINSTIEIHTLYQQSFKEGFQKALELIGDKKFSESDVKAGIRRGYVERQKDEGVNVYFESYEEFIQSLQQTEWDVEIEMWFHGTRHKKGEWVPKLDADGCLILKRV